MANTYFFTGFPGFIATSLIRQMARDQLSIEHIYLLVQPRFLEKAQLEIKSIASEGSLSPQQFSLIAGDITKKGLGIGQEANDLLRERVTHVFHLAAVYDLAVSEQIAFDVNVSGTKNVNEWTLSLFRLKRYIYFSTAYVSGKREGRILETELDEGQSFKNHYEHTKFLAEQLVEKLKKHVPVTIIRPGIVRGHSVTGETVKFDGPYFILNFFDRLSFLPFIPNLGRGSAEGNFVPVDYIFRATIRLAHHEAGAGKTYHLTDPNPYTMKEVYGMLMQRSLGRDPFGQIPLGWARMLLSFSAVRRWLRVEQEALDYFICMSKYDCSQAQQDLMGTGIACPDFKQTAASMVSFYQQHKNDRSKHLNIH